MLLAEDEPGGLALADPERRDVAIRAAGVTVAHGAVERLRAALEGETTAATASALPGAITAVGTPAGLHPRLAAPVPGLVLVGRAALDLLDVPFTGAGRELLRSVSEAAAARGLQHLLVPDVLVSAAAEPEDPEPVLDAQHETPVGLALRVGARADGPISVTVDLRCLWAPLGGTQVHALEAAAALARREDVRLRALTPHEVHPSATEALARLEADEWLGMAEAEAAVMSGEQLKRTDVFHRPFQVTDAKDLDIAELFAHRLTITHQDLISYRVGAYHDSADTWAAFRRATRLALARADAVLFESEHARADALADGLVEPAVAGLAPIGVDHRLLESGPEPHPPAGLADRDRPYVLMLGSDFAHKQRPFALRLTQALIARGWDGRILLAGPAVGRGGTAAEEAPLLAALGDRAVMLDAVDESEKAWLYSHAVAVAYPTTYEGFGLIPFEAAAHGTPCLFAPVASLAELLTGIDGGLEPWDPDLSAERTLALLADPQAQVEAIRARARTLTWDHHAELVVAALNRAVATPKRLSVRLAAGAAAAEAARGHWEGMYWHLHNAAGPAGLALVGPDEPLLDARERGALAAALRRPLTARPLRRLMRLAGRTRVR